MRRVVFVNRFAYPDRSATSQLVSDLATALAERGWQVTLVASRQLYDDPEVLLPLSSTWGQVQICRVRATRFGRSSLPGRLLDYLTFYLALPMVLWRVLTHGSVVVAKTDPPILGALVAGIAALRGAPLVNWLQDLFPEVSTALGTPRLPSGVAAMLRALRNVALRAAAANVVIGERMGELVRGQGVRNETIHFIPNWAHENQLRPIAASESGARRAFGYTSEFVVGYSGNLGRAHDFLTFLEAIESLRQRPGIQFLFIGGGHGYELLRSRAATAGLTNIRFLPYGPLADLGDAMAAADLHLVSLQPKLEGLIVPSKFYGIAAAGRPVAFVGDVDGEIARLIEQGKCGFSVPQGRGDLLAAGITRLAGDPSIGLAQGQRARALLDSRFSRSAAHCRWDTLLRAVQCNNDSADEIR